MEPLAKATLREAREHNERLVLATIYDNAPISRAEVARQTGLTRTTVSDVVDGLIVSGLAHEVGRGPSTGGKAPILLEVPETARTLIGVDLGDRVFTAATVNLRGEILERVEVPSEDADGDEALDLALGLIERVVERAGDARILGIGIGAPGLVDPRAGEVIQAVKRDWRCLPLATIVAERFGVPAHVANDSQAAALAEHVFGAVREPNLVLVKVGQGIGAGLVIEGQLFTGDSFGAGEIGHTVVEPSGDLCRCGNRGCLETIASARAVLSRLAASRGADVTLEGAVAEFAAGDPEVREVVLAAADALGRSLAGLIGVLHIRRIVLAGTMAAFGVAWLDCVRDVAFSRAFSALTQDTTFELGGMEDIVVLGASALLMTRELGLRLRPLRSPRRTAVDPATPAAPIAPIHGSTMSGELLAERGGAPD